MATPPSAPIFIFSAPRSGTTWLVNALNAHPDIHATELRAFGDYVDMVQDQGAAKPRLRITLDAYLDALLNPHAWAPLGSSRQQVRDELLRDVYLTLRRHAVGRTGKPIFVDKLTPYLGTATSAIQSIARLFPDAKVILLIRDGRDVAVSGVMHWLTKDVDRMTDHQRRRRAAIVDGNGTFDRFFTDDEIDQWASHWRETIAALDSPGLSLKPLVVRYERMSEDLPEELRRICDFIGVASADDTIRECAAASTFEKMSGGRSRGEDAPGAHVRKGVVGDWRGHFTAADGSRFHRLAGAELLKWGYEPDPTWLAALPEQLSCGRDVRA